MSLVSDKENVVHTIGSVWKQGGGRRVY